PAQRTLPRYDPGERSGSDLHAKEASMTSVDDAYFARTNFFPSEYAFTNQAFGGPGGVPVYSWGVIGYGFAGGVVGCGGEPITRLLGPYSTYAGVHGTSRGDTGVAGTSVNHVGVYGQVEDNVPVPAFLHAGVLGTALTPPGAWGISQHNEGVIGSSFGGTGVCGDSARAYGVLGFSGGTTFPAAGVLGVSGPEGGPDIPQPVTVAGVVGSSGTQHGVIGTSNGGYGVYGFSANVAGVYGETSNPAAYAGVFNGNVHINGVFTATVKNAAVPFPDGTQRVLHCMESPEHWFEDFG